MKLATDFRIRLIGILVIAIHRFGLMQAARAGGEETAPLLGLLDHILLASVIIWESSRLVVVYFQRRYPTEQLSRRRFTAEALTLLLVTTALFSVHRFAYEVTHLDNPTPISFMLYGLLDTLLYSTLVAAFYKMLLFIEAWQKANQEAEQLKKANLISQLDSLKNQVKPHFLFNSLNTLTALVEKDSDQAVKFIAELSKVYRYLLQSNEKELISLTSELEFTQAYFFLLQTRFGNGIALNVDVADGCLDTLIPPLTLQILVENAVKHNQVSVRKPLQVNVLIEQNRWLVVTNNIQRKRVAVPTNGMGLSNIATKYKLLNQPDIVVTEEPKRFNVKIPLIQVTTP
ncbi:hypothetical protein GCM10023189_18270 [Nibrella saemangeumensis]|uniref:Signal transduction histidine kinase internal region domain-containing protein n=1 Tax=Nibrella saemangeumensis TaxID=1084526 RepID=A0ABP8MNH6_9BACT